jgi:hypothetical protein
LLACNLTKQFNTSLNNLRRPYWLGVNYCRSAFMHYLCAWMERKAGCENHLRLWTRMLDLLCIILIFKYNDAAYRESNHMVDHLAKQGVYRISNFIVWLWLSAAYDILGQCFGYYKGNKQWKDLNWSENYVSIFS